MTKKDYFSSGHIFNKDENLLAFQFYFFNIMLGLATVFSPFIAYLHKDMSRILFYSDMVFSFTSFILILLLRQDKKYFTLGTYLFIPSLYITITLVFFLAGNDPTKVIWAPIFFACAFLLQGSKQGLFWLFAILSSYFIAYYIYGEEGVFYSLSELMLISIAFITVSLIFNAFRQKNEFDNDSMMSINADLYKSKKELEAFSSQLEERIAMGLIESQNKTKSIQQSLDIINKHVLTAHIDLNGLITNVSTAYCNISGYEKNQFIAKPFTLLFDAQTPLKDLKALWKDLKEGQAYTGEVKNMDTFDNFYWLDMHINPEYTSSGEKIGYVCIAHNITDKKLVIEQQEQLIAQSRHAAMGEMISMIAHQWRQPLATISAITTGISMDISLGSSSNDTLEEKIESISKQVQHLSHTVDDFRDFFKPTKGVENTYVKALVSEAIKLLDHRLTKKIEIKYTAEIDLCLALYRNELVQVLINILNNACDALESKGVKNPCISINEYVENSMLVIEIQDNAGGIEEKALAHVFDPYFSTKTKNGTGLGLYMSKTIVEDHQKGILEAFNQNKGAMFRVSLPISICKF
ncbi:MAG: hypothetical protein COA44_03440 [Arcobacter sp.]|nr:MAG: hypothetical protein COA44_03440 [Arcobacter sp.]